MVAASELATQVEAWFNRNARSLTNPEAAGFGRVIGVLRRGKTVPVGETQKVIDRLTTAYDSGRLRRDLVEALEDEPFSRFDEWADSLREVADAIDHAKDAIVDWTDAEDREEKANFKDDALDALESLVQVWDASPLDLSKLCDDGLLADWELPPDEDGSDG